jgi:hypothetical protein
LASLGADGRRQSNNLTNSLLTTTKLLGTAATAERVLQLGQAYVAIAKAGVQLKEVDAMLGEFPKGVKHSTAFSFFENLASLQRSGVSGVSKLFSNCREAWLGQVKRAKNHDVSGFFNEAQTALNLQRNGYRLISVSSKHGGGASGVEYDLIATSPQGETQAIEVKLSLEGFLGKNEAVWRPAEIHNTQLYRFLDAAKKDGLSPVVAVMHVGRSGWGVGPVGAMFTAVKEVLGTRPALVNAETGLLIQV